MSLFAPYTRSVQIARNWAEGRPTDSLGTTLTGGASHTLSAAFTELFSATTFDTHLVRIMFRAGLSNAAQSDQLVNIYIGAGGSETLLIPTLLAGWTATVSLAAARIYEFPLFIPAGSRISAKSQALIGSDTVIVNMELFGGGEPMGWCGRAVECLGAVTAASQGTSVTPGAASEGSFTNIGTTAQEWRYVLPMIQGTLTDTSTTGQTAACDVGVGGAVYKDLTDWWFGLSASEFSHPLFSRGRHVIIPASTTLQLRGQVSGATAEAFDACIYGVY